MQRETPPKKIMENKGRILVSNQSNYNSAKLQSAQNILERRALNYEKADIISGVWHYYVGLGERNSRGRGLKQCTGKPSTPNGFLLFHYEYILEKLLH